MKQAKRIRKRALAIGLSLAMAMPQVAIPTYGKLQVVKASQIELPAPVYSNDFEDGLDDCTVVGDGEVTTLSDVTYHNVFQNGAGGIRSNYLQLPSSVISDAVGTNHEMTISFDVNVGDITTSSSDYSFYSPFFGAYASKAESENGLPMLVLQSRGLVQTNCMGWSDFTAAENAANVNTESTSYLFDGNWHNVAVTFTTTKVVYYVDGNVLNTWNLSSTEGSSVDGLLSQEGALSLQYVCLGGNQAWNWNDLDTAYMYDNVAFYDTALSQEQLVFKNIDTLALDTKLTEVDDTYTIVTVNEPEAVIENADSTYNIELTQLIDHVIPSKNAMIYDELGLDDVTLAVSGGGASLNGTTIENAAVNQVITLTVTYGTVSISKNFVLRGQNNCSNLEVSTSVNDVTTDSVEIIRYHSFDVTVVASATTDTYATTDSIKAISQDTYSADLESISVGEDNKITAVYKVLALSAGDNQQIEFQCGEKKAFVTYSVTDVSLDDIKVLDYNFTNNSPTDTIRSNSDAILNHSYIQDNCVILSGNTSVKNNYSYVELPLDTVADRLKASAETLGVENAGFTISFDVKPEDAASIGVTNSLLVMKESALDGVAWGFFAITSNGSFQTNKDLGTTDVWWAGVDNVNNTGLTAKQWSNITLVAKNNTITIYVNGEYVNETKVDLSLSTATADEISTYGLDGDLKSVNGFIHYLLTATNFNSDYKSFANYSTLRIGQTDIVGNETWMNDPFNGSVDNVSFYQVPLDSAQIEQVMENSRVNVAEPEDTITSISVNEVESLPSTITKETSGEYDIVIQSTDQSGVITEVDGICTIDLSKIFKNVTPLRADNIANADVKLSDVEIESSLGTVDGLTVSGLTEDHYINITFTYKGAQTTETLYIVPVNLCNNLTATITSPLSETYEAYDDSFNVTVVAKPEKSTVRLTEEVIAPTANDDYGVELLSSNIANDYTITNVYQITPFTEAKDKEVTFACGTKMASVKYSSTITYSTVDDEYINRVTTRRDTKTVGVHDPSIVMSIDEYGKSHFMVFGTHMGTAKSDDLQNWQSVYSESETSNLFGVENAEGTIEAASYNEAFKKGTAIVSVTDTKGSTYSVDFSTFDASAWNTAVASDDGSAWTVSGNMWAPDVIYNEAMGKWCMYLSLNGTKWNSVIIELVAEEESGPYVYYAPVVYSGFNASTDTTVGNSYKNSDLEMVLGELDALPTKYDKASNGTWGDYWPHAIDPCVFYDASGKLHLAYGSWSGGIFELELDETTGLRDYSVVYESNYPTLAKSLTSDEYFGKKIAGGYYVSGEGPYVQRIGDYYYLFMSYGFLSPDGGYNVRVFRSENPDGPYVDTAGKSAIYSSYVMNYNGSVDIGEKLMGNYKWNSMAVAEIAQGHNSAFVDLDGKAYIVYHTKFYSDTHTDASFEVRVHQLYQNEDGWLVEAPYSYAGETISETGYDMKTMAGTYDVIVHKYNVDYEEEEYVTPVTITLQEDGTITGEITGTWTSEDGTAYVNLTTEEGTFKGVFCMQYVEDTNIEVPCFTAVNSDGLNIWGSKQYDSNVSLATDVMMNSLPEATFSSLDLVSTGDYGTKFVWKSSNTAILSDAGVLVGSPNKDTFVVMSFVATNGKYRYSGSYTVKVHPAQNEEEDSLLDSYYMNEEKYLYDYLDGSLSVDNPFYYTNNYGYDASNGVKIKFKVKNNAIKVLNTIIAFMGDQGSDGRLYFTSGSYLGYNANGSYFDANLNSYTLVQDYLGTGDAADVEIVFKNDGFELKVNGESVYDQTIIGTENGAGTITDYSSLLDWLYHDADTMYFGYGSWWSAATFDECESYISDVQLFVNAVQPSYDTGVVVDVDNNNSGNGGNTNQGVNVDNTSTITLPDGTKIVTTKEISLDGTIVEAVTETATDGTSKTTVTETSTNVETNIVTAKKVVTSRDNTGKVTGSEELYVISDDKTELNIATSKDAKGNVVSCKSNIEIGKIDSSKVSKKVAVLNTTVSQTFTDAVKENENIDTTTICIKQEAIATALDTIDVSKTNKVEVQITTDGSIDYAVAIMKESVDLLIAQKDALVVTMKDDKKVAGKITIPVAQLEKLSSDEEQLVVSFDMTDVEHTKTVKEAKCIKKVLTTNKGNERSAKIVTSKANTGYTGGMTVTVPVEGANVGDTYYVYRYNGKTNKLEEIPNAKKSVSSSGCISIQTEKDVDYVISDVELSGSKVTTLLDQVNISMKKKSINVGASTLVSVDLGTNLSLVEKFTSTDPYLQEEAKVSYKVSDSKIASISANGKIKAKAKGTVTITVTVKLENKETKKFTQKVTIK